MTLDETLDEVIVPPEVVVTLEDRVVKLEDDLAVLSWLYAEMLHNNKETAIKLKTFMLQRAFSDPAVQKQIIEQLVAREFK